MNDTDDLRTTLADEVTRRRLAEARLAHYERKLAEAQKTIKALARLAASCPGINEVGVIAHAALVETLSGEDRPPRKATNATVVR